MCHEGATRRTVDVRGDRPGAGGHSTLATYLACATFFVSNTINSLKAEFL